MTARGWAAQHKASNLVIARLYVKLHAPYLAPTLFGLIPTAKPNLTQIAGGPLAVTERLVMYFDPEWVEEVSVEVLATGLAHECMHSQLEHVNRGKKYADKKRWNIAGDLFINGSMKNVKRMKKSFGKYAGQSTHLLWTFPDWAHMPEDYGFEDGLTADAYYQLLADPPKKKKKESPSGPTAGKPEGEHHIMHGCCGGVAGNPLSNELEGQLNQEKGRSEHDVHSIAVTTAKAIKSHMEATETRGNLPGNWSELIDISESVFRVPWRAKLGNVMRQAIGMVRTGGQDYSLRRPSRRSYLRGFPLPGLVAYDPDILFIVDSSGSMSSNKQLPDALRVCSDVMVQTGIPTARWMEADTEGRREPMTVGARNLARSIEIKGRGGTDFRPAIERAVNLRPKPRIIIYITEGDGPAPRLPPPGVVFIWVIVPSPYRRLPARWGEVIVLEDEDGPPLRPPYYEEHPDLY